MIKPPGVETVAPSAMRAAGEVFTDAAGLQPYDEPRALSTGEVRAVVQEHRQAALNARRAGFDGVELHGTSGYLPMQFLSSGCNRRSDAYGGRPRTARASLSSAWRDGAGDRHRTRGPATEPGQHLQRHQDEDSAATHAELMRQAAPLAWPTCT
jgi:N-ethylmaleimide reductase